MATAISQIGNLSLEFSADHGGTFSFQAHDGWGLLALQAYNIDISNLPQGCPPAVWLGCIPPKSSQFVTFQPYNLNLPSKSVRILHSNDESHLGDSGTLRSISVDFFQRVLPQPIGGGQVQLTILQPSCRVFQKNEVHVREFSPGLEAKKEFQNICVNRLWSGGEVESISPTELFFDTFNLGCFHPESIVLDDVAGLDDGGD